MADEWAQYASTPSETAPQDEWSQYASSPEENKKLNVDRVKNIMIESVKDAVFPKPSTDFASTVANTVNSVQNSINPFSGIVHRIKSNIIQESMPDHPVLSTLVDLATDPETYAGVTLAGEAKKASSKVVNFGGNKALNEVAQNASKALDAAQESFSKGYDTLFEKVGNKIIPSSIKDNLLLRASDALEQTAPNSLPNKFLSETLPKVLSSENVNVKELHALKGNVFKMAKSSQGVEKNALMQIYSGLNESLSSSKLAGSDYAKLTQQYHSFLTDEAGYVKGMILDKFKNVTSQKLSSKFLGIKTPINLADNYRTAFKKLSGRETTTSNVLQQLDAVRRGELLKRAIIGASVSMLVPQVRSAAVGSAELASRIASSG